MVDCDLAKGGIVNVPMPVPGRFPFKHIVRCPNRRGSGIFGELFAVIAPRGLDRVMVTRRRVRFWKAFRC